ncbi:hypothetical protein CDAR_209251 [Caerostris darwini]|uniref:Uncharacterized protein n=1 Tax=Caerostris darwini TaxID=1538125 RepID=A0AAV4VFC1_9ARAC|nr:hypothetical protein CDAR_209251 [Caerostris darwini]
MAFYGGSLYHPVGSSLQIHELHLFCESLMAAWRFGEALSEITRRNPIPELLRCRIPMQGSMERIRLLCFETESFGFRFLMLSFGLSCFELDHLLIIATLCTRILAVLTTEEARVDTNSKSPFVERDTFR